MICIIILRALKPVLVSCLTFMQHYASRHGNVGVCQVLLSAGACVNSQTPGGATPLHRAAYCGHEGVVKELMAGGADLLLVDSDGQTALHKVRYGQVFMVLDLMCCVILCLVHDLVLLIHVYLFIAMCQLLSINVNVSSPIMCLWSPIDNKLG